MQNKKIIFVGDVHGRIQLLLNILDKYHTKDYFFVFLGDLNDYTESPEKKNSYECICFVKHLVEAGLAECIQSNHQDKLMRWLKGNAIKPTNGLDNTILDFEGIAQDKCDDICGWLIDRPFFYEVNEDGIDYLAVHAYFDDHLLNIVRNDPYWNTTSKGRSFIKSNCIYGPVTGNERLKWYEDPEWARNKITKFHLVCGHYHTKLNSQPSFTMIDTDFQEIIYYIPSKNFVGIEDGL